MTLISGLAAPLIYDKRLRSTPASVASICELSFPVTAVAVHWLILDARLSGVQIMGSVVLIAPVTVLAYAHGREQNITAAASPKLIRS